MNLKIYLNELQQTIEQFTQDYKEWPIGPAKSVKFGQIAAMSDMKQKLSWIYENYLIELEQRLFNLKYILNNEPKMFFEKRIKLLAKIQTYEHLIKELK